MDSTSSPFRLRRSVVFYVPPYYQYHRAAGQALYNTIVIMIFFSINILVLQNFYVDVTTHYP